MPFPRLHSHKYKSILLVEDDVSIREALKMLIELEGYVVFTASNGMEALDKLTMLKGECHPCLIITDLMMPIMAGDEFLKVLQASDTLVTIPIALMTASPSVPLDVTNAKIPIIRKPFALDAVMDIVRNCCEPPESLHAFEETTFQTRLKTTIDELKSHRDNKTTPKPEKNKSNNT